MVMVELPLKSHTWGAPCVHVHPRNAGWQSHARRWACNPSAPLVDGKAFLISGW